MQYSVMLNTRRGVGGGGGSYNWRGRKSLKLLISGGGLIKRKRFKNIINTNKL